MDTFATYIKDHVALTVVLAVILVLIIVLAVLLIVQIVRSKKLSKETPESVPEPEDRDTADDPEPEEERNEPDNSEPEDNREEENTDEIPENASVTATEEQKETATAGQVPAKDGEKEEKPVAAAVKKLPAKKEAVGKWILYEEERGGYGFKLVASNGEMMLKSSSPYASLSSAKSGIKTYQDNIAAGRLEIVETKKGNFFVQVNNANKRLLATSADYKTRSSCESAMESIKRWAATTVVVVETPEEEDKK